MILIADSGSTKTEWYLMQGGQFRSFRSSGYNPVLLTTNELESSLTQQLLPQIGEEELVEKIFYYGAGCSSVQAQIKVRSVLMQCFKKAKQVEVQSDLWASVRACCGKSSGIACILGTGSNACIFDGQKITDRLPSLGYLLGDEGSGKHIGSRLLRDYFYADMPTHLSQDFAQCYALTEDEFVRQLYEQVRPNRFLASFVEFALRHRHDEYIQTLVRDCFRKFIRLQLLRLSQAQALLPVHFVGSIAAGFEEELIGCLAEQAISVGKIMASPFPALLYYHVENSTGNEL